MLWKKDIFTRVYPFQTHAVNEIETETVPQINILLCDCLILPKPVIAVTYFVFSINSRDRMVMFKHQHVNRSVRYNLRRFFGHGNIINRCVFRFSQVKLKVNNLTYAQESRQQNGTKETKKEHSHTTACLYGARNARFYWVCRTESTDTLSLLSTVYHNC